MVTKCLYNGVNLNDFNCAVDTSNVFNSASKSLEKVQINGRNGDLILSNDRYDNISVSIPCFIRYNFKTNFRRLTDFLKNTEGYCKLETGEEADLFRLACFYDVIEASTTQINREGQFTLVFDCKPQIFLKSGQIWNKLTTGSQILINPTYSASLPLFQVKGTGTITVNDTVIQLNANTGTTTIDCETGDAYQDTINRNGNLIVTDNQMPKLNSGNNNIKVTGFSSVQIMGRWFQI